MVALVPLLHFADQAAHKNFLSQRKQQILTGVLIYLKNLRTIFLFARITFRGMMKIVQLLCLLPNYWS